MIFQLSDCLHIPLRDRNHLVLAAGFAPIFQARPLEDPEMRQVIARSADLWATDISTFGQAASSHSNALMVEAIR